MDQKDKIVMSQQLENYKINIDLVVFAVNHGYTIDIKKDSPSWKFLRHSDGDALIIHRNPNGHYFYTNVYNSDDCGTIIDFVQQKILNYNNLGEVRKYLDNFSGSGNIVTSKHSLNTTEKKSIDNLFEYYKLYKLSNTTYLNSRGISDETLLSDPFINRIFNRNHEGENGISYINTVFPIYNKSGICGLDQKNKGLKSFLSGSVRANGFWRSNYSDSSPIKNLFVIESPVDGISHYELNPFKKDNNLYLATCGTPSHQQISHIEAFLNHEKLQPEKLAIAFDNDCPGEMFTAQLLGKLQSPEFFLVSKYIEENPHFVSAHFDCHYNDIDKQGVVSFSFNTKSLEDSIHVLKDIEVKLNNFNLDCKGITTVESPFKYKYKSLSDATATGEITFPQVKEHWTKICEFIKEIKYNNSQFLVFEKSINKDFNDDLLVLKGLKIGLPLNNRYSKNFGVPPQIKRICNVDILPSGDKISFKILLQSNSQEELKKGNDFINARIKEFNADKPNENYILFQKSTDIYPLISLTSINTKDHSEFIKKTISVLATEMKFNVTINTLKENLSQKPPGMKM